MDYLKEYRNWCASDALDAEERAELAAIAGDPAEIEERFYCELEFGTAGLRGVIRMGTNGMNVPVVRRATQGLADYIRGIDGGAARGVCIAYDSRRFSERFARETACVLAANGVRVRLFSTLHAVPQLSFAVRHQGCIAGVVITTRKNTTAIRFTGLTAGRPLRSRRQRFSPASGRFPSSRRAAAIMTPPCRTGASA